MTMTEAPPTKHAHNPGFLALIEEAKTRVRTCSIEEFIAKLQAGERFVLVDTREESEWAAGHLPSAHHLSKGIIERDIETAIPDKNTPIVTYCGGGFRSVLASDNLQKMGYTNVISLDGGWRGWNERGLPVVTPEAK